MADPTDGLTRREREILELLAEGKGNKEIAAEPELQPTTIKSHIESILVKLDAHSRSAAVAAWFRAQAGQHPPNGGGH